MFDYDWFHGSPFQQQQAEAKRRCTALHFSDLDGKKVQTSKEAAEFHAELEVRTLIYLRDGFSYEVKEIADVGNTSHLCFECEPVDDHYKVGAFVVTVPFDEIVRVEVYAVHPSEKPDDLPQITGFRGHPEPQEYKYPEPKPGKGGR